MAEKIDNLVVLSSPTTTIMPVKAVCGGEYVDESGGHAVIMDSAVWTSTSSGVSSPGRIVISPSIHERTRYVGIEYPDESTLPYIPVRGKLFGENMFSQSARYRFTISSVIFEKLMTAAKNSYAGSEPNNTVKLDLSSSSDSFLSQDTTKGDFTCWVLPPHMSVHTIVGGKEFTKRIDNMFQRTGRNC